jgi:UDP-2,3-diacylglucosamine hydrolase
MGSRIGIIAGSGQFPLEALDAARKQGYDCVVAGIRGEAAPGLKLKAENFEWIGISEFEKLIAYFKRMDVREVVFVGKVEPNSLFRKENRGGALASFLAQLKDKTPTSLLAAIFGLLSARGFSVKDPGFLLGPFLCPEGVLGRVEPSARIAADIEFGWPIAAAVSDLEIGQTVAVKEKAIVAVESMEGTDETVKRAGRLAGDGTVVVKAGRSRQDMRIDVPAVGLATVRGLARIQAAALCIEADRVAFFQKTEALAVADANGMAVVARKR